MSLCLNVLIQKMAIIVLTTSSSGAEIKCKGRHVNSQSSVQKILTIIYYSQSEYYFGLLYMKSQLSH